MGMGADRAEHQPDSVGIGSEIVKPIKIAISFIFYIKILLIITISAQDKQKSEKA
jgi:hypothetical protein